MYGIEWLVGGLPVARDCVVGSQLEAIQEGRRRASEVARTVPGRRALAFRLVDSTGETVGIYRVHAN